MKLELRRDSQIPCDTDDESIAARIREFWEIYTPDSIFKAHSVCTTTE